MDGYNAVTRLAKERSQYVPVVKKCIEAHRKEEQKEHQLGFEWHDIGVWPIKLMRLATEYDLLTITYKSNSATCYMVKDIEGVQRAIQDIEVGRIAPSVEEGVALRVWLSASTTKRLKAYVAREFPEHWEAENLVVERALNLFLDEATPRSEKEVNMKPVACWHVRDYKRLRNNLERGICDLWPQPRADRWFKRMRLYRGARVQFCAIEVENKADRGLIVATGTIDSEPQPFNHARYREFQTYVKVSDVVWLEHWERCPCYRANPRRGSHRLGGRGPCS